MPKIADIQETPNPNAVKFILKEPVSHGTSHSFKSIEDAENNLLAKSIFSIGDVVSVFYMDKMIDPGNRYNDINKEASMLRVSSNPIKITQGFQRTQQYLRTLPPAKTMEEIEKGAQGGQNQPSPTANGTYQSNIPFPSGSRAYSNGGLSVNIPSNWRDFPEQDQNSVQITFAPNGAYGNQGITHGAMIGVQRGNGGSLQQDFDAYVKSILQGNSYLQARSNYSNASLNGRNGYSIILGGRSPITNRNESVRIYGTQTNNGSLLYLVLVVPEDQGSSYNNAFNNIYRSLRLSER